MAAQDVDGVREVQAADGAKAAENVHAAVDVRDAEDAPAAGGVSRRGFVLGSAGGAAMLALGLVKFAPETALCRPPGGQDEDRLLGMCVRCGKCMEVCPTGVIAPAHIEDGIVGVRTPRLDFRDRKPSWEAWRAGATTATRRTAGPRDAPRCALRAR